MLGELDEALASGTRALDIAERLGDVRVRIVATGHLEPVHFNLGEFQRVVALATDDLAVLLAERVSEYVPLAAPPSVFDRVYLIQSLVELGRFAEAAEPEAEAFRLAALTQNAFTVG